MKELQRFIEIMDVSEEEAMVALISALSPPVHSNVRAAWLSNSYYGNTAPKASDLRDIYDRADYRCTECSSQLKITIDHINGNPKDHSLENLRVLCFKCNRALSSKPTVNSNHKLLIYNTILEFSEKHKRIPTQKEIAKIVDLGTQISQQRNTIDWISRRLASKDSSLTYVKKPIKPKKITKQLDLL